MPYAPKSPYAITKITNEMYAKVYQEIHGLNITCLRYFNVYGKRQDPHSDYAAVIPKFINMAINGAPLTIFGDGLQTRDFVYVEDVVNANLLALGRKQSVTESFNIANSKNINLIELARMILKFTASDSEIKHLDPAPGDIRDSLADISFASKSLGFKPAFTLEKGLHETVKWFSQKP
jgi:UDP-glucose 4-epimerase